MTEVGAAARTWIQESSDALRRRRSGEITSDHRRDRAPSWTWALYAFFLGVAAIGTLGSRGFIFDDPFIFSRYAENLVDGHGWVYNVGQSGSDAATSPLYVLALAGLRELGIGMEHAHRVLFIAGLTTCACATHAVLAFLGRWWAGAIAGVLIVTSPWLAITRGMESTLFLGAVALALYFWLQRRDITLGITLAILVLIRPDGVVFVLAMLALMWWVDRRPPVRTVVAGAAVAALWGVYAIVEIGQLLPDTLSVKVAQGQSPYWGKSPHYLLGFGGVPKAFGSGFVIVVLAVFLLAVLGLVVVIRDAAELRLPLGLLLVATLVTTAVYTVLNVPAYEWYYALPVYTATVFAGVALDWIAVAAVTRKRLIVALTVAGTLIIGVWGFRATPKGPPRPGYADAAQWIAANTPSDASVAATEIGMLGWYSKRHVVDYLGLVDPAAVEPMREGDMQWWVNHLAPDYWMALARPSKIEDPVKTAPWFHHVFAEVYRNYDVVVYRRIGRAPSTASSG